MLQEIEPHWTEIPFRRVMPNPLNPLGWTSPRGIIYVAPDVPERFVPYIVYHEYRHTQQGKLGIKGFIQEEIDAVRYAVQRCKEEGYAIPWGVIAASARLGKDYHEGIEPQLLTALNMTFEELVNFADKDTYRPWEEI